MTIAALITAMLAATNRAIGHTTSMPAAELTAAGIGYRIHSGDEADHEESPAERIWRRMLAQRDECIQSLRQPPIVGDANEMRLRRQVWADAKRYQRLADTFWRENKIRPGITDAAEQVAAELCRGFSKAKAWQGYRSELPSERPFYTTGHSVTGEMQVYPVPQWLQEQWGCPEYLPVNEVEDETHPAITAQEPITIDPTVATMPWYCISADNPVIDDQATQAEQARSAGGWSDVGPEPDDVWKVDTSHANQWADFRRYIARQKEERTDRFVQVFDWLRRQRSAEQLRRGWKVFRKKNRNNYVACREANDWTALLLTKKQREQLERYYEIRMRQLQAR